MVSVGNLITVDKKKYIVVDKINFENETYLFVNEVAYDDISQNYYFMICKNDMVSVVTNEKLINSLLKIIDEKIKDFRDLGGK